ncbi:LLM class flavin-dependent oxidoreductase [Paeniglutamicibacter psychrophenolicus]|uniref:LLM class flavin-dependent oxidoreductase n=1 Tax=Paeniglutamicibacter psychrophenolicus TaxID=257454 RepID=UPI002786278E|nr:LLM class flavin-dependent oxidoreductase [Paeniglutamicibacter psychrophenolicus]MDQ0094251.1 luciferase family oxidoreductase group 1 [Paeniglutamicibacter psychrophenolicus]
MPGNECGRALVAAYVSIPMSILDLAPIRRGGSAAETFAQSVELAQTAEATGYKRVWYAEHHNMSSIASSATSVLIGHVAHHTNTIRLGAGGVMLPNHSPLVIAEQFGTLETLFPGRIDLGLGRAPGTDQATFRALRRDPSASDAFPHDVLELQAYFGQKSRIEGVNAYPGHGTNVPLYILGSSMFGARLAAQLGLPYSFASHFAPDALVQATTAYRNEFQPSEFLAEPWVIAGVGVVAAETNSEAHAIFEQVRRDRIRLFLGRNRPVEFTDDEVEMLLDSPHGDSIMNMLKYTAVGDGAAVAQYLEEFARTAQADELITVHNASDPAQRLESVKITAKAMAPAGV